MFWKKKKEKPVENKIVISINDILDSDGEYFELNAKHIKEVFNSCNFQSGKSLLKFLNDNAKVYADNYSVYFDTKQSQVRSLIFSEGTLCNELHSEVLRLHEDIKKDLIRLRETEDYKLSTEPDQRSLEDELISKYFDDNKKSYLSKWSYSDYVESFDLVKDFWGTEKHFEITNKVKDVNFKNFDLVFEVFSDAKDGETSQFVKSGTHKYKEATKAASTDWVERGKLNSSDYSRFATKLKVGEIKEILKTKDLSVKGKKDELLEALIPVLSQDDLAKYLPLRDIFSLSTNTLSKEEWVMIAKVYSFSYFSVEFLEDFLTYKIEAYEDQMQSKLSA